MYSRCTFWAARENWQFYCSCTFRAKQETGTHSHGILKLKIPWDGKIPQNFSRINANAAPHRRLCSIQGCLTSKFIFLSWFLIGCLQLTLCVSTSEKAMKYQKWRPHSVPFSRISMKELSMTIHWTYRVSKKTSPSSARVAAMCDRQQ